MDGIVLINKEKNCTSRDVVNQVSKILKTKKIGHTGTLDPIATGVLVLCIGKATKLVEVITSYDKEYEAEVILGIKTDTKDITGEILKEEKAIISKENIEKCLKQMIGTYNQTVPIYSAVKINGKKLYEYARNNEEIELPKRKVTIKELKLISDITYEKEKTKFKIKCHVSKGTYIRSLIEDIATNLNTIGTMENLKRTKQGNFQITSANTIQDIENNKFKIYSIEEILEKFYKIEMTDDLYFKIKNGSIIKNNYNHDIVAFTKNDKVIAIYKEYSKDKTLLKPWKMFL
ncbi:MAG: tRNA pseudouridine(55) synthase TruB [Bacilli bacterium]